MTYQVNPFNIYFGADPEFFLKKDSEVIGAEKILRPINKGDTNTVIIDGVQAEFNPYPSACRETFGANLQRCFSKLNYEIQVQSTRGQKIEVDFRPTVKISPVELSSLSGESQQFGCAASQNVYGESQVQVKDASKYYHRSAGGHLHLGHGNYSVIMPIFANLSGTIPMLDILLGNTCVLIDRDPGNIERRKNYGRAGEYRTPKHGIEYRTLSNFWLRSYPLMSFVTGMARFTLNVVQNSSLSNLIRSKVNMEDISKAINTNDFDLALENFNRIKEVIAEIEAPGCGLYFPLQGIRMKKFESFYKKGINSFFNDDIMNHWLRQSFTQGWERFLDNIPETI